jgi:antitoxin VapB
MRKRKACLCQPSLRCVEAPCQRELGVYTEGMHAKVFQSGNSQAVRLPKTFRFRCKELEIFRRGDEVVLREISRAPGDGLRALATMPKDFFEDGRHDPPPEDRGW